MNVHDKSHSAAVCVPKEPDQMSRRERGMGVPYVQGLLRNKRRTTKRYGAAVLPTLPHFLLPPTAVAT